MRLFNIIPENFFSILASTNKHIYLRALFSLRKAYQTETFLLKKDLVVYLISDLEPYLLDYQIDDPEDDGTKKTVSYIIHSILRRFMECKWIDEEYLPDSFDIYIIIPDYSIKILNLLYELANPEVKQYNGYVFSTYSGLRTSSSEDRDYYIALEGAYNNTNALVDELKSFLNNIRRYYQLLLNETEVKGILKDYFEFHDIFSEKVYYPIKTFDSFTRYKNPILGILKGWLTNQSIKNIMIKESMIKNRFKTEREASDAIIDMIVSIIDKYEDISTLLNEIDKKNLRYTRASVEKIQYLLNMDGSLKGKLIDILKNTSLDNPHKNDSLLEAMNQCIDIFQQGNLSEDSLFKPRKSRRRIKNNPLPLPPDHIPDELSGELNAIVGKANETISRAEIQFFMENQFMGKHVLRSADLALHTDQDYILAALAAIYYDDQASFYNHRGVSERPDK
jgi:hypothetical protein